MALDSAPRVMIVPIKSLGSTDSLYSMTTHPVVYIILVVRHVHVAVGLKPEPSVFENEPAGRLGGGP
jgi:hypothetical protein